MAPPKLYWLKESPPARAVLMTAKTIGLDLEIVPVDLMNGAHLQPDFLKKNPQHTVPVLEEDDGFAIWESHAIMAYIVGKYGKDDSLYPKDLRKRAVVDQRLHFESGVVFRMVRWIVRGFLMHDKKALDDYDLVHVNECYEFLESFLEGKNWAAGENVTIADFSLAASISDLTSFVPLDTEKFPKVDAWLKRVNDLPFGEVLQEGHAHFDTLAKNIMG